VTRREPTHPAVPPELWLRAAAAAADRHTIDALGILSPILMERAALACAEVIQRARAGRPVRVLCGPGNNGGDGVAIARILHGRGVPVQVHLLGARRGRDLAAQIAMASALGVTIEEGLPPPPGEPVVIVDAMLGTGAAPPLRGDMLAGVVWANEANATRVAVDLPTGVDADTGATPGPAIRADHTITFQRSKPGLHVTPGRQHAGEVVVADIGLVEAPGPSGQVTLIAPGEVRGWLAGLRPGAHKGERGHVAVVGGSAGTPGAAVLAGTAALRAGAGIVTIAAGDAEVQAQLLAHRPELMVTGHADPPVPGAGVLVVGPGLTAPDERAGLAALWRGDPRPAVWDASALVEIPGATPGGPRVLTPHPAEAGRLLSLRTGESWTAARVQADRLAAARALAACTGAVAVLKGEGSVVAEGERVAVAVSGSPALATAGTGDCLAGLIGALMARGLEAWAAACAGVHVHGVAGELADARRFGAVAADIADAIGRAVAALPADHPRWPRSYRG
jgi:NAD(P)H-hydrate epimerase